MGIQMGPVWPRARRSQTSVLHTLSYASKNPDFRVLWRSAVVKCQKILYDKVVKNGQIGHIEFRYTR